MKQPRAPSARAFRTSWPLRTPPSMWTSISLPTASTMAGSASMLDCAPSSCRPPWLLTIRASAPLSAARRASAGSWMPLRMSLPPQSFLIHSTSPQFSVGSNCDAVHSLRRDISLTPWTWPTMLPNWRRFVPSMPSAQRGLVAMLIMLAMVSLGGALRPLRISLWRCPRICRSSVSTKAEHCAALARSISLSMKPRSFMTYN